MGSENGNTRRGRRMHDNPIFKNGRNMEFDDSSEKLRRNLIVFCFGYLATAYLGISLIQILELAGLSKVLENTSQIRINAILIVVLFYLSFRWFTSENYRTLSRDFSRSWVIDYQSRRSKIVTREILSLPRRPPEWIYLNDDDFLKIQEWYENAAQVREDNKDIVANCWPTDVGSIALPAGSKLRLYLYTGSRSMNELEIDYRFKTPLRFWIAIQLATTWAFLKKEEIFEVGPPIVLALSAEFLLVFRIVSLVKGG